MIFQVQAGRRFVEHYDNRSHLERRFVARRAGGTAEHQRRGAVHRVDPRARQRRELLRRLELGRLGPAPVRLGQVAAERHRPVQAGPRIAHARQLRQRTRKRLEQSAIGAAQQHLAAVGQAHHTGDGAVGQGQRRRVHLAVVADGAALEDSQFGVEPVRLAKRRAVAVGEQRKIAERKVERLAPGQLQPQRLAAIDRLGQCRFILVLVLVPRHRKNGGRNLSATGRLRLPWRCHDIS